MSNAPHQGRRRGAAERAPKTAVLVAKRIVRDIVEQRLEPGDRLPSEAEMIAQYQVGRASVREALRLLEVNGLITVKPGQGGGPVVSGVSAANFAVMSSLFYEMLEATVRDVVEARVVLEPVMAGLVANTRDPEQIERLQACIELGRVTQVEDQSAYIDVAHEFHRAISHGSGNRVLDLFADSCWFFYERYVLDAYSSVEARKQVLQEHERIAKAIIAGDAKRSEQLMRQHVQGTTELLETSHPETYSQILRWT